MNYLFYGGARDTGKSGSIYKIADYLINTKNYTVRSGTFPSQNNEFECIIKKGNNIILIKSNTDNVKLVKQLKNEIDKNKDITHVITANRNEGDWMRNRLWTILNIKTTDYVFEIPLGKVISGKTRKINITWYLDGILNISKEITKNSPFNF